MRADELRPEHIGRKIRATRNGLTLERRLVGLAEPRYSDGRICIHVEYINLGGQPVINYSRMLPHEEIELLPITRDDEPHLVMAEHRRTAVRADATPCCPHTPGGIHSMLCPTRVQPTRIERIGNKIIGWVFCPDCLLPRFMPTHWLHR